jgi:outer membrane protein OmpA-like peptidoglycan-associated protein
LLALFIGAIYFFSRALEPLLFPASPAPVVIDSSSTAPPSRPSTPPTPAEVAARQALRDGTILQGTAADKILNFLLSGKQDFNRELYELTYHQFNTQHTPVDSLRIELSQIAQIMQAYPQLKLDFATHTDGSGSQARQQQIATARALQIKDFLLKQGIAAARISTIGYGGQYPIANSQTPEGRRLNQRVEIMIRSLN